MSRRALADRRIAARSAWMSRFDQSGSVTERHAEAVEAVIGAATRVRLTDDIVQAGMDATSAGPAAFGRYHTAIKAAFKAAGFEVEQ